MLDLAASTLIFISYVVLLQVAKNSTMTAGQDCKQFHRCSLIILFVLLHKLIEKKDFLILIYKMLQVGSSTT